MKRVRLGAALAVVAFVGVLGIFVVLNARRDNTHLTTRSQLLKAVTNPDSLYVTCIEMLDKRSSYRSNRPELGDSSKVYIDFGAPMAGLGVPSLVVALNPQMVILYRDYVSIVIRGGGFGHLEIVAYRSGNGRLGETPQDPRDSKLREGLWITER